MNRFTAKIGGLPAWVWALILGLLLIVAMYWFKAKSTPATVAGAPPGGVSLDTILGPPNASQGGTSGSASQSGGSNDPVSDFVSNALWTAQGVAILVGGGESPLKAQIAIEKYLAGQPLTQEQADLVNVVVQRKGVPPQGVAAIPEVVGPDGLSDSQRKEEAALASERAQQQQAADAEGRAARFENFSGNAANPTGDDLAYWQAEYRAKNGGDIEALDYWRDPAKRTKELRDKFAADFSSTHGGIK